MANIITAGNSTNGGTAISTDTSGTLNIVTGSGSGATAISVDTSQNVGVGTTSPTKKLDVNGDANINGLTVGRGGGSISSNTALGSGALAANTTGSVNTAIGKDALSVGTASAYNTAIGQESLTACTGTVNTAIGYQSGTSITSGTYNTCVGYSTGKFGASLTTGSFNVYIGTNSGPSSGTVSNEILISCQNSQGKGANTAYINGNGGSTYNGANTTTFATTSDQRLKKNIVDNKDGLNKITNIRVRNFEYRLPQEVTELDAQCAIQREGVQLGVIAQEIQQILPDCVHTESTGVLSVQTDNLVWYLVNSIQELKSELDALKAKVGE